MDSQRQHGTPWTRREFVRAGLSAAAGATAWPVTATAAAASTKQSPRAAAEACLLLWLGGGAAHVDTFDPKRRGDGKKKPGSYYDSIETAIPGARVCEHLGQTAALLDRCVLIRSLSHDISNEHGAASNLLHKGRRPNGAIAHPSLGSVMLHERGPRTDEVPAYVVMGYPNITRDPGFLGARHGYVYLTQIETGPAGLLRPPDVDLARQRRRERLLQTLRSGHEGRHPDDVRVRSHSDVSRRAFRMAGGQFVKVFDLQREPADLRQAYGSEFGQRCLLARRLVEAGARFVEVSFNLNFLNGTGWDTHNEGQLKQHLLIRDLDRALATLITDLERRQLLDKTLVVVATEFGRPPEFDSGGGRGHQSKAFSALLAGGGLRAGQVVGRTDDLGGKVVERPVSVADFHATLHRAMGIDPGKELYDGDRPVPITDHGRAIEKLFG